MVQAGVRVQEVMTGGLAWQNQTGEVLGCYVHGLFENESVLQALFGVAHSPLERAFDRLADWVELHLSADTLQTLV